MRLIFLLSLFAGIALTTAAVAQEQAAEVAAKAQAEKEKAVQKAALKAEKDRAETKTVPAKELKGKPEADASSAPKTPPTDAKPAEKAESSEKTETKSDPPAQKRFVATTVLDEQVAADEVQLAGGALTLATDPPRSIPLDELQRIMFGGASLTATWIGQDNRDLVQVGAAEGGNKIQDVRIRLAGLPFQPAIKQVRVVRRSPPRAWRMVTTGSPDWRLAMERTGASSIADLYLEPSGDMFGQELKVTITFEDNSTKEATVTASTHTNESSRVASKIAPAKSKDDETKTATHQPEILIELEGHDRFHGHAGQWTEDSLVITGRDRPEIKIPLLHARGIVFDHAQADAKARYQALRPKPAEADTLLLLDADGKLAEITGRVKQVEGDKLKFEFEGKERSLKLDRVQAIVFAAHPSVRSAAEPFQEFHLATGDVLSGKWTGLTDEKIELELPWGDKFELPADSVAEIRGRNGKLVHLSDIEPLSAEQASYFGRLIPYRVDESFDGKPIKIAEKTYPKGLAVHSRCVLNYAVDGQYSTFKTLVGFDASAGQRGRVVCRVLGDGQELFAKTDLRSTDPPETINVSLEGVKLLTLEVDFGEAADIGDRVLWAEPRLLRK